MESGKPIRYVYLDYEPLPGIRFRHTANYRAIRALALQEHGVKVSSKYATQVKRT